MGLTGVYILQCVCVFCLRAAKQLRPFIKSRQLCWDGVYCDGHVRLSVSLPAGVHVCVC